MILDLSYIKYFPVTDNIIVDALKLLNINNKKETAEHCLNVAELCAKTAKNINSTKKPLILAVYCMISHL